MLGVLCVWAWPLERRVALWRAWRLTAEPQRLRLAALYAAGSLVLAALALALAGAGLWLLCPPAQLRWAASACWRPLRRCSCW